jgi:hypothetical protein
MLARITDERINLRHHSPQRVRSAFRQRGLEKGHEARFSKLLASIVNRLDHSVRKDEKQIAGDKPERGRRVRRLMVFEQRHAEGWPSG